MQDLPEGNYPGHRREAVLWATWAASMYGVSMMIVISAADWWHIFPDLPSHELSSYLAAFIPVFGGLILLKIAKLRGTTALVSERGVQVREWYGKVWWFPTSEHPRLDRKLRVFLLPGYNPLLRMPTEFPNTYRLYSATREAYVMLDDGTKSCLEQSAERHGSAG